MHRPVLYTAVFTSFSLIALWLVSWVAAGFWTGYAPLNVEKRGIPTLWNRLSCNLSHGGQVKTFSGSDICFLENCAAAQVSWKCVTNY